MQQNFRELAQRHASNLKRTANISNNGTGLKYDYIYTHQELLQSWLDRQDTLGYPLRVEPKRDRYVMNSKALQEDLTTCTTIALDDMQDQIIGFINNNVRQEIERNTFEVLGSFGLKPTGVSTTGTGLAKSLGTIFGKALAKNIMFLLDETMRGKKPKKKKRK